MLTKHPIVVHYGWLRKSLTLPAGTRLVPATNIPEKGCYWVNSFPKSLRQSLPPSERSEAWDWNLVYGFLIRPEQLAKR